MSLKKYKTILSGETFESEYEINKSKFIAHVKHVEDEETAKDFLQQLKKKYYDATHNCSAWVLGVDGSKQKSNDDGEPGGTAGNPILETIKKNELVNIMVVVTRYFGGIKLGAGGLIRAYSHTAALGISTAKIVTMTPMQRLNVTVNYNLFASVENWIRNKNITVENKDYSDNVTISLLLLPEEVEIRLTELKDLTAAKFSNKLEEEILVAVEAKEKVKK